MVNNNSASFSFEKKTSVGDEQFEVDLDPEDDNGDDDELQSPLPGPVNFLRSSTTGDASTISELGGIRALFAENRDGNRRRTTSAAPPLPHTIKWPGQEQPPTNGVPSFSLPTTSSGISMTTLSPTRSPTRLHSGKPALQRIQRGNDNIKNALNMVSSMPCLFGESPDDTSQMKQPKRQITNQTFAASGRGGAGGGGGGETEA
jgi:hypothetical protein